MSSYEVINQIIRAIVQTSTEVLKSLEIRAEMRKEEEALDKAADSLKIDPDSSKGGQSQVPQETLRTVNELFLEGIHTHVKPIQITDTLSAFMIRAVVLNPQYGFNVEKEMSKGEVDRLVTQCVHLITSQNDIEMETIRCQVYFDTNFPAQDLFLHKERLSRLEECSVLLKDIVDTRGKSIHVMEPLNRKIVSYALLRSNIGIPTDIRVIREATAALESVFPPSELKSFLALTRTEKETQLNGLTNLISGIRLFNKHLEKGGETIEPLPDLCSRELTQLTLILNEQTKKTEDAIQYYKALLDYKQATANCELSDEAAPKVVMGLVFQRQYLVYLDALRDQVVDSEKKLIRFGVKYEETVSELKYVCKSKTAVPVDQVYPLFITLATLWTSLFDILFLLSFRRGIVSTLVKSSDAVTFPSSQLLEVLVKRYRKEIEPEIMSDAEIIKKASSGMPALAMANKHAEIVHPGNTTQYYKLPVEFGGFCAWSLVKRNGLVTPGDKNIGMVRFKDKLFCFSDQEMLLDFFKSPDDNIEQIIHLSRVSPSYVQLLHLYKFFPTVETLEKAQSFSRQRLMGQIPIVSEVGCQVDTHIVDYGIDRSYKWNEWDLRRDALMLVNLKKKLTHSTQTVQSHFKRESETQHYQQKQVYDINTLLGQAKLRPERVAVPLFQKLCTIYLDCVIIQLDSKDRYTSLWELIENFISKL